MLKSKTVLDFIYPLFRKQITQFSGLVQSKHYCVKNYIFEKKSKADDFNHIWKEKPNSRRKDLLEKF